MTREELMADLRQRREEAKAAGLSNERWLAGLLRDVLSFNDDLEPEEPVFRAGLEVLHSGVVASEDFARVRRQLVLAGYGTARPG